MRKTNQRIVAARHIKVDQLKCVGKESNSLEAVDGGLQHSDNNVYTVYDDPRRTEWIVKIQPALKKPKLEVLVKACGNRLCRREIIELRAGRKKPHRTTQELRCKRVTAEVLVDTFPMLTYRGVKRNP